MRMIITVLSIMLLSGCATMDKIARGHLDSDRWDRHTAGDAMAEVMYGHLNVPYPGYPRKEVNQAEFLAKQRIYQSEHVEHFQADQPRLDKHHATPGSYDYLFIYFEPRTETADGESMPDNAVYLVVLHRLTKGVVYDGVYEYPDGNRMYKYHPVLSKL